MHFGDFEVHYIDGGAFRLDGGAMFGVVPKVLWDKKSPPDESNRIWLRANSLLVRTGRKTVVIETGNGRNGFHISVLIGEEIPMCTVKLNIDI